MKYPNLKLTGNPFISVPPIGGYDVRFRKLFTSRSKEVEQICRRAEGGQALFVIGPFGGGKTVVLLEAMARMREAGSLPVYASFDRKKGFRQVILEAIRSLGGQQASILSAQLTLEQIIESLCRDGRNVVLVVDDLDRATDIAEVKQVTDDVRDILSQGANVVVTGQPFGVTHDLHTSAGGIFHGVTIPEFTAAEFRDLMKRYLESVNGSPDLASLHPFDEEGAEFICNEMASAKMTPRLFNFAVSELLDLCEELSLAHIPFATVKEKWTRIAERAVRSLQPLQLQHLETILRARVVSEDTPDAIIELGGNKYAEYREVQTGVLRTLVEKNLVYVRKEHGKDQFRVTPHAATIVAEYSNESSAKHSMAEPIINRLDSERSLVWLHLSDLHCCKLKTGWDAHRVLQPLIKDLKKMEKDQCLTPQLLFFTGDAAFGNIGDAVGSTLREQFDEAHKLLDGARTAFSKPITIENVFIVPGNHDVDREEISPDQTAWLAAQTQAESVLALIQKAGKHWQRYLERLSAYRDFLDRNGYKHLLTDPKRLVYSQTRTFHDRTIGIAGFNSAWSCGQDGEKGKLWFGGDWQSGELIGQLGDADFRLALSHHPFGWFVEAEDTPLRLLFEREFLFHLHGHEHLGWVDAKTDGHVRVAAAACYDRSHLENGYNLVRLNLNTGEGEVWLRRYDSQGGGWVPRVVAGKTTNDGLWKLGKLTRLQSLIVKRL